MSKKSLGARKFLNASKSIILKRSNVLSEITRTKASLDLVSYGVGSYGIENLKIHSWDRSTRLQIGKYCSLADEIHIF